MMVCRHFSQRATCPPRAAVRQLSMADITFNWPRLTWPALAWRHTGPWARKISATSSGGRGKASRVLRRWSHPRDEMFERAGDLAERLETDARIERGGIELLMPEQHPGLRRGRLWITRMSVFCSSRCVAKLCRSVCSETDLSISAICAAAWQARLSWRVVSGCTGFCPGNSQPCGRPAFHQARSSSRRCGDSITKRSPAFARAGSCGPRFSRGQALALLDADDHAGAVDVANLERDDLRGAQSRPIGNAQLCLVFEARRSIQEAGYLLRAQHDWQPPRLPDERQVGHELRLAQRHHEQEPQRGHGVVDGRHAGAGRHQMKLIAAQILKARRVRRGAEKGAETLDGADIAFLRPRRELAHSHIVDHATA